MEEYCGSGVQERALAIEVIVDTKNRRFKIAGGVFKPLLLAWPVVIRDWPEVARRNLGRNIRRML